VTRTDRSTIAATALVAAVALLSTPFTLTPAILVGLGALALLAWTALRIVRREGEAALALSLAMLEVEAARAGREALLNEAHHRVKNNLQVTSSLIQMQARRFTDPAVRTAFQETQDRLRSIGAIHDALLRTAEPSGDRVDLGAFLARLVEDFAVALGAPGRGVAIELEAEAGLTIEPARAVPLALALGEAVSNALKHAFPPGSGGRVTVTARGANGELLIEVRDTGPGLPEPQEAARPGALGLRLMRAFAAQLGGRFTLESDNGAVFRLSMPLTG